MALSKHTLVWIFAVLIAPSSTAAKSFCTVCRDGSAVSENYAFNIIASSAINYYWGFSTACSWADQFFEEIGLESQDPECDYLQAYGSGVCGCPPPSKPCTLCADGNPITNPSKIGTMFHFGALNDGIADDTCGFAEIAASYAEEDSPVCNTLRYSGYADCGCSSPPPTATVGGCTSMCEGGGKMNPSLSNNMVNSYLNSTCADYEKRVPYLYSCHTYQKLEWWLSCGCAVPPPPMETVENQCILCFGNSTLEVSNLSSQTLLNHPWITCGEWKKALLSINKNDPYCDGYHWWSIREGCCLDPSSAVPSDSGLSNGGGKGSNGTKKKNSKTLVMKKVNQSKVKKVGGEPKQSPKKKF